jgi:hypothetical protein
MSAPRYMMEAEFEPEGYMYEEYDNQEADDDAYYYSKYGMSECTVCMGGSYIRKVYIDTQDYEEEADYDF